MEVDIRGPMLVNLGVGVNNRGYPLVLPLTLQMLFRGVIAPNY